MTIYLYHGDDQAATRRLLNQTLDQLRREGQLLTRLDGLSLTAPELESVLSTANLFQPESLVIDNLCSRLKSQEQTACLALLANYHGPKHLLLWEKKELSKTMLKQLPKAKAELVKVPAVIFRLLDSLVPSQPQNTLRLLHQTAKVSDEGFIFVMLARRVSDLLVAKSGDTSKLSPWQRSRLVTQAQAWSESQLLSLHTALVQFDHKLKTGKTKLSYLAFLDITLASLVG